MQIYLLDNDHKFNYHKNTCNLHTFLMLIEYLKVRDAQNTQVYNKSDQNYALQQIGNRSYHDHNVYLQTIAGFTLTNANQDKAISQLHGRLLRNIIMTCKFYYTSVLQERQSKAYVASTIKTKRILESIVYKLKINIAHYWC